MQNVEVLSKNNKRRIDIDVLKGIGIILVLIGHSFQHGLHFNIIYSFHMPLFFVVAGYFFKKRPIVDLLKKDFARLLVPYYFIIILIILLSVVYNYWGILETIKTEDALKMLYNHDVGAIWFLAALFWSRQLFNIMLYVTENKWFLFFISLLLMIGVVTMKTIYGQLPYYTFIFQGISGVIFVFIGYVAKGVELIGLLKSIWRKLLLGLLSIAWILSCMDKPMNMMRFEYHHYIVLDVLYAVVAIYICYLISYYIAEKTKFLSRFLSFMGIYSLVILCWGPIKFHFFPIKSLPLLANLITKILWLIISLFMTIKIPLLKKIFQIQERR